MRPRNAWERPAFMVTGFAVLNVTMYWMLGKFWIGGSSFLPLLGQSGAEGKFLFALGVNIGVIAGAFLGARFGRQFLLRLPPARHLPRALLGGLLIGIGVTLAPGTCTTAFVTGMPMLSVSSFLSVAGMFLGAYAVFALTLRKDPR